MESHPSIVWDVNNYYRSFGVHWTADRTTLRDAYLTRGGERSPYLTYVLKQLLHEPTRAEYDRCRLGSLFVDDYVLAELRRIDAEDRRRRGLMGEEFDPDEEYDLDHLLDQIGMEIGDDEPSEMVDEDYQGSLESQDDVSHPDETLPEFATDWIWSYYLDGVPPPRTTLLVEWQTEIVAAFGRHGIETVIGLGVAALDSTPVLRTLEGVPVVFVDHRQAPDASLADRVVAIHTGDE